MRKLFFIPIKTKLILVNRRISPFAVPRESDPLLFASAHRHRPTNMMEIKIGPGLTLTCSKLLKEDLLKKSIDAPFIITRVKLILLTI